VFLDELFSSAGACRRICHVAVICGELSSPNNQFAAVMCGNACGAATSATPRYHSEMVTGGLWYWATAASAQRNISGDIGIHLSQALRGSFLLLNADIEMQAMRLPLRRAAFG
jgi:hypothetical protein